MKINDFSTPVVVLNSLHHGGLGITRTLGRLGIRVYAIAPNRFTPALFSRYCRGRFLWDLATAPATASLQYLDDISRKIGGRPVLLPSADDTAALFVANNADRLAERFIFPKQNAKLTNALSDKQQMFYLAKQHGISTAETTFPRSREDVLSFAATAMFPVMLKGVDGTRLKARTGLKMLLVHNTSELVRAYTSMEDPLQPNLMLQEYIPGGDDTVWMFNGYFNSASDCLVGFTGQKLRQTPVYTGMTSLGVCRRNEIVENTTKAFMKKLGYTGVLDIGYKYDARDGGYKLLDANPRIGATFRLFVGDNGLDVVRALYLDLTGQHVPPSGYSHGRKWMVEDRDFFSCLCYARDKKLGFSDWVRSLKGVNEGAFCCGDDPLPVLAMGINDARMLAKQSWSVTKRHLWKMPYVTSSGQSSQTPVEPEHVPPRGVIETNSTPGDDLADAVECR